MTSPPPPPSYEELAALVVELKLVVSAQAATIERLEARIVEQDAEITELKRRLATDSHNSSKPSSSDGLRKKPAPKSLRRATGRKPSRAKGDPGGRLELVTDPHVIVDHHPAACGGCGDELSGAVSTGYRARQVFDLPEIRPEVTEHRLHQAVCGCGHTTSATAPDQVTGQAVYGPGVRAAIAYLSAYQHLPAKRLAETMENLFALPVSTGTVLSVPARAHEHLADFEEQLKEHLSAAPVAHADESGVRVAGKLHWLHVMCTHLVTYYGIHTQRGRDAMDDLGVLPAFTGTLVTDALASYTIYGNAQALCGAHVLRELIAVTEDTRRDPAWAQSMIDVLLEAKDAVAHAVAGGHDALPVDTLTGLQDRYRQAALCGITANPYPGTGPRSKARALACRLRDRTEEYQRYMVDFTIPFDNNAAERDLRMIKVQQKISGSWRTLTGARRFARIRSYISTVRKHGLNPLTALRDLFAGRPWTLPATS
ncbi:MULTISPECIES: IS66 family transposase [unclassified Streptomyces]|uniref:IS66 family transposase n=1 Tax=unclassified Streptomyces TaxID=2593676 RepID=UPI000DAC288C|nr:MULTISPECIES: IS66 family transposase [unclassified Streptomyces]PZT75713.1 IS66 family transposase [Streptomyces sp. AC1-42W]PZT80334.1 IS66 family transposase [Streptomyces sp. AC1-42T]